MITWGTRFVLGSVYGLPFGDRGRKLRTVTEDRYEVVADFYESGWVDAYDDPVSLASWSCSGRLPDSESSISPVAMAASPASWHAAEPR